MILRPQYKWNTFLFHRAPFTLEKRKLKHNSFCKLSCDNIGTHEKNHGQYLSCAYDIAIIFEDDSFFLRLNQT